MLHRLRLKFILTNMLLVTLALLAVFSALMISTARQLEREGQAVLTMALRRDGRPQKYEVDAPRHTRNSSWQTAIPVFCVTVGEDGSLTLAGGSQVQISRDTLERAVEAVLDDLEDGGSGGVLREPDLRYQAERTAQGTTRIAFSDRSWERASLARLLLNSLLIGAGALAVFFAISLALARQALRPVERAWAQQRQFVADASHELKTPLTVILANTGIVLAHPGETVQTQAKWMGYIQAEAQRMKKLVEDMLFLARQGDEGRPPRYQPVNFSDLATSCALRFEPVAFEGGVTLDSRLQPDLWTAGEAASLERLVLILLDNGVKYAGDGGRVSLTLVRRQDRLLLTVGNTGAPIPPEHLPHLFERFYRVDSSRSRQGGGYGLGLAIAQTIVQAHRGHIDVTSTQETGTLFTVSLPAQKPREA